MAGAPRPGWWRWSARAIRTNASAAPAVSSTRSTGSPAPAGDRGPAWPPSGIGGQRGERRRPSARAATGRGVEALPFTARSVRFSPRTSASPWCHRSGPALDVPRGGCVGGFMAAMVNGREPAVTGEVEVFLPETSKVPSAAGRRRATAQVATPFRRPLPRRLPARGAGGSAPPARPPRSARRPPCDRHRPHRRLPTPADGSHPDRCAAPPPDGCAPAPRARQSADDPRLVPLGVDCGHLHHVRLGSSPAPLNTASISANTASPETPRRAPTPTTRLRAPDSVWGPRDAPAHRRSPAFQVIRSRWYGEGGGAAAYTHPDTEDVRAPATGRGRRGRHR
ncbi:hypothetical protein SBADM41S_01891 [Streptomyces badius]